MTTEDDLAEAAAASIWNDRYGDADGTCTKEPDGTDPIDYTQHDFLYRHLYCKPLTGIPTRESLDFLMRTILGPVPPGRVLAVGSGLAFEEERLVAAGILGRTDAWELSTVAVASARERLAAAGLADRLVMHAGDVGHAGLADASYDAVFVHAAIHHFFNIEEMMALFHRVLKPGGMLVYNEYVGPDLHMYHDHVRTLVEQLNACLDESLRRDETRGGNVRHQVPWATREWMLETDPSEGVHAARILPLTYRMFDVVHRYDYGGTLMRPFWVGILNNFDFSDPRDRTIARLAGLVEDLMIGDGRIPSYHCLIGARKGEPDPDRPEIDNEILTDVTRDHGARTLAPTHFGAGTVITCQDHSDDNWARGVIRHGPLRLLVAATGQARRALEDGRRIVLDQARSARIDKVEWSGDMIIVHCSDETLDREALQAPVRFWVSPLEAGP